MALYDPNEFPAETKTDFTLADILAWARKKPADEAYTYSDSSNCALCQFLRVTGRAKQPGVWPYGWKDRALSYRARPGHRIADALADALVSRPHTFGAFADRLEKALSA